MSYKIIKNGQKTIIDKNYLFFCLIDMHMVNFHNHTKPPSEGASWPKMKT